MYTVHCTVNFKDPSDPFLENRIFETDLEIYKIMEF